MKTRYLLLVLPLCGLLTASSCKKEAAANDDYIVRENNQEFGAYLNGQPWKPNYRDAGNGIGPIDVAIYFDPVDRYHYMWVRALKTNEEISLYIPPPLVPGRKLLNQSTIPYPYNLEPLAYGLYEVYSPNKKFITNNIVSGYIDIISCDTIGKKVEARFEYEAINTATNEKVTISNGSFKKN